MSTMKSVIQNCYTRMLYKNAIQNIIHNLARLKIESRNKRNVIWLISHAKKNIVQLNKYS